MKEELITLKELIYTYSESKKKFDERKEVFNEAVKGTMLILASTVKPADYEATCEFYNEYHHLHEVAERLKKEHPRYGEKRVKETLLAMFKTTDEYQDRTLCAEQIVDAYLTLNKAGFNDVKTLDEQAKEIGLKLVDKVDVIKTEKIDVALENANKTIESAKPYAEQAKKQLTVFGGIAKNAIGKGAKRLIKILEEDE